MWYNRLTEYIMVIVYINKIKMNSLKKPHWRLLLDPGHFLSFGFGSGLSPFAPGTLGTILAIPIALFMNQTSLGYRIILAKFSYCTRDLSMRKECYLI